MWVRMTGQSVTDLSVLLQKSEPSPYILRLFKEKFKKTRYVVRSMQLSGLGIRTQSYSCGSYEKSTCHEVSLN